MPLVNSRGRKTPVTETGKTHGAGSGMSSDCLYAVVIKGYRKIHFMNRQSLQKPLGTAKSATKVLSLSYGANQLHSSL
jgi:hypothetical protein